MELAVELACRCEQIDKLQLGLDCLEEELRNADTKRLAFSAEIAHLHQTIEQLRQKCVYTNLSN
jgi:ubiquinone biosynthesis protein UbiJ